jgi:hypothetical protein
MLEVVSMIFTDAVEPAGTGKCFLEVAILMALVIGLLSGRVSLPPRIADEGAV